MNRFFKLLSWELLTQNKVNNLVKYLFALFLFCTLCIALANTHENIGKFGVIFSVIYIPIALLGFSIHIFKSDLEDGSLEVLLTSFSSNEIILAKFTALYLNSLLASFLNLPIIFLAFDPHSSVLIKLAITTSLELMLACALIILIGSVQSYFRSNTNFLPQLLMSFILPAVIFSGLAIENAGEHYFVFILVGINMVLIPTMLTLAAYLTRNIYGYSV